MIRHLAILSVPLLAVAMAQPVPEARPGFDVASVKRCTSGELPAGRSGGRQQATPGRIDLVCATLADLIHIAYDQNAEHRPANSSMSDITQPIKGGPAWIYSERYDIEAKSGGAPSRKTMMGPMLQTLLEERFRLKVHQESEEITVYALTVAKGGPKLQPMGEGGCVPMGEPSEPGKPRCGTVHSGRNGTQKTLDVTGMTVGGFASLLRNFLDRPVVDQTGITGQYRFHLEYTPDELTSGLYSGDAVANPESGLSIFTAIQQQLGLKLAQAKGPHGFLVIDHVERLEENRIL